MIPVRALCLSAILSSGVAWSASAAPEETVAVKRVLDRLAGNVDQIGTLSFRASHVIVYRPLPSGTSFTLGILQQVDYDRIHDQIHVERLSPDHRILELESQAGGASPNATLTGISLWILDPWRQVSSYSVSVAPSAPSGHVVLVGVPSEEVLPLAVPHWEALIDKTRNRLVSVTEYADTGEVHITLGFEDYAEFLGGRVVLPQKMLWREFARRNALEGRNSYDDLHVTGRGANGR